MTAATARQHYQNLVHYLRLTLTGSQGSGTFSMGWIPAGSVVVGAGVSIQQAWNGSGNDAADIGFRNMAGVTDDPNAFTETALDLDAAAGHIAGDVVSAANVTITAPAEITVTTTDVTSSTNGIGHFYVMYIPNNG